MRTIKIICTFLVIISFTGCFNDDEDIPFFYEFVPIEAVVVPDQFTRGETAQIMISYFRPTTCHGFFEYRYLINDNERFIRVVNVVVNQGNCRELERTNTIDRSIDFLVGDEESYIFRFWQGLDDQGNDTFLTIEVPVVM